MEFKNPIKQLGRLFLRDPGVLMNASGNIFASGSFPLRQDPLPLEFLDVIHAHPLNVLSQRRLLKGGSRLQFR